MRKVGAVMVAATIAVSIAAPARADGDRRGQHKVMSQSCDLSDYAWCVTGDHWPLSKLPVRMRVNSADAPSAVRSVAESAAVTAATTWDAHWPLPTAGTCRGTVARALCIDGASGAGFGQDGANTILWGDPARCTGGKADSVAVACIWYESGSSLIGGRRIAEVDIILNATITWRQPSARDLDELAMGEIYGAVLTCTSDCWYDVQSALTHELGHVLGLDDIGVGRWPSDLLAAGQYPQTMYRYFYGRATNKRTIEAGDIAGLIEAAAYSATDIR